MITDPPLYTASGGPKSHSIRRKKTQPLVRQKTLPTPESPCQRKVVRQRSLSPSRLKEEGLARTLSQSYCDIVTTNRRLILALDQFTSTALPFYLELITRYTNKIQKVRPEYFYFHQMEFLTLISLALPTDWVQRAEQCNDEQFVVLISNTFNDIQ